MSEIRGLSLTQPWAQLVAIGAQTIETRSWPTRYRGLLAIHAAKSFPHDAIALCHQEPFRAALRTADIQTPADLPRGAIVAVARLMDCWKTDGWIATDGSEAGWVAGLREQERAFGDYSPGRYGWLLSDVRMLYEPTPCRGALGLWRVPDDVLAQMGVSG